MPKKVLILDTSILCVWLRIPGMDSVVKKDGERITPEDVDLKIKEEVENKTQIVLPLASIIECGNHITQIKRKDSKEYVDRFADFIDKALDGTEPWDIFFNQEELFKTEKIREWIGNWRQLSQCGISMGDASIIQVAYMYDKYDAEAEIYTADEGLRAYQPAKKKQILPRNRNRR